jgi:hypothetical protein
MGTLVWLVYHATPQITERQVYDEHQPGRKSHSPNDLPLLGFHGAAVHGAGGNLRWPRGEALQTSLGALAYYWRLEHVCDWVCNPFLGEKMGISEIGAMNENLHSVFAYVRILAVIVGDDVRSLRFRSGPQSAFRVFRVFRGNSFAPIRLPQPAVPK